MLRRLLIKKRIIGTAVGGVLAGLTLEAFGYLDDVTKFIMAALATAASALAGEVAVPGWLLVLGALVMVVLTWAAWPRLEALRVWRNATEPNFAALFDELTEVQRHMFGAFHASGRDWLTLDALDSKMSYSRFRIDKAADELVEMGLIIRSPHAYEHSLFELTKTGRDFLVFVEENGARRSDADKDE